MRWVVWLLWLFAMLPAATVTAASTACRVQSDDGNVVLTIASDGSIRSVQGIHQMQLNISSVSTELRLVADEHSSTERIVATHATVTAASHHHQRRLGAM